jgi:hypothetical protein
MQALKATTGHEIDRATVTMFATIIPTLHIARTDPATTLRDE